MFGGVGETAARRGARQGETYSDDWTRSTTTTTTTHSHPHQHTSTRGNPVSIAHQTWPPGNRHAGTVRHFILFFETNHQHQQQQHHNTQHPNRNGKQTATHPRPAMHTNNNNSNCYERNSKEHWVTQPNQASFPCLVCRPSYGTFVSLCMSPPSVMLLLFVCMRELTSEIVCSKVCLLYLCCLLSVQFVYQRFSVYFSWFVFIFTLSTLSPSLLCCYSLCLSIYLSLSLSALQVLSACPDRIDNISDPVTRFNMPISPPCWRSLMFPSPSSLYSFHLHSLISLHYHYVVYLSRQYYLF